MISRREIKYLVYVSLVRGYWGALAKAFLSDAGNREQTQRILGQQFSPSNFRVNRLCKSEKQRNLGTVKAY